VKIIIIGAGFTGALLTKALIEERNSVVLIDQNPERARSAADQFDCTVIEADGSDLEILEKAGISSADALVTLTGDDETNMLISSMVDVLYPNVMKIARVRDYDRYRRTIKVLRRASSRSCENASRPIFGIDHIVNPDVEAATSIMRAMEIGAVGTSIEIGDGYAMVELPVGEKSPIVGLDLKTVASLEGWSYLVAYIESGSETFVPNGESVLNAGDRIGVLIQKENVEKVLDFTGISSTSFNKVAIFGADNISALTVASQMDDSKEFWYTLMSFGRSKKRTLTVIDRDIRRCQELAQKFPKARILNGDITDDGLLQNEGVCESDLMVAASGNYERNLMISAYMKLKGVSKVIALTSDSAFDEIAEKLGVDVTVPMRDVVIDAIISHLRGRNVKSVHSVAERKFEIVSFEIAENSKVAGKCLKDISDLEGALVLLVKDPLSHSSEIPNGSTVLSPGAQVVVIMPSGNSRITKMFTGRNEGLS
jgi:trk system potassium uptake protein TrkA